ncbi:MAG: YggT family protein [Oscillochloris sp.]|nr:YggT family protein [Oscillochloris sp.]
MHIRDTILPRLLAWVIGALEALLLARLLARLLAARPDNPTFVGLYAVTGPLVAPLAALDLGQPRFGAVLELSTLLTAIAVPLLALLFWRLRMRPRRPV